MAIILGLGLVLLVPVLVYSVREFLEDLQRFIAPDTADENAINRKIGEGSPQAREALKRRFGKNAYLKDAARGLSGLAGLALLYWVWFG